MKSTTKGTANKNGTASACEFISSDWTSIKRGELGILVSYTFNVPVFVWDDKTGEKESKRPTIAGLIDAKTNVLCAHFITTDFIESEHVMLLLKMWHSQFNGFPIYLHYDQLNVFFRKDCMFRELGINVLKTSPYGGSAAERYFYDAMRRFDKFSVEHFEDNHMFDERTKNFPLFMTFNTAFYAWMDQYHVTEKGENK